MASESTSPRNYAEPCHLYKYFLDKPTGTIPQPPSTPSSSSSGIPSPSMLVTGFGLRSWDSLQRALLDDEQRRQLLLAQYDKGEACEYQSTSSSDISKFYMHPRSKSTVISQQSAIITVKSPSLQYLMGLAEEEEAYEEVTTEPRRMPAIEGEVEEEVDHKSSAAMRKARKYLNQHRIFEFYRFLIAHMLSELPDNPIEFLINLLDRCLLYRSGFGDPPLLFEKPHIEQLFNLMDRMNTGFIEVEQYETGMKTLGICSFEKNPPLSSDGMVPKDFFIEEAYECLTDLFVDMIIRRGGRMTPPSIVTPPPTAAEPSIAGGGQ